MVATFQDTPVNLDPVGAALDALTVGVLLPTQQEALTTTSATEVVIKQFSGSGFIFVQANQLNGAGLAAPVRVTTDLLGTEFNIAQVEVPAGEGLVVCSMPAFIRNGGRILANSDGTDVVGICYSFVRIKEPVTTVFQSTDFSTLREILPTVNLQGALIGVKEQNNANEHGLLLFDISALASDATIIKATLRIVDKDASGISNPIEFHHMLVDWVGSEATWEIKSTGVPWGTDGGGSGVDFTPNAFASRITDLGADEEYVFDVTALVRKWHSGSLANNGFMMINTLNVGFDNNQFASVTNADVPARPTLTLETF